MEAKLWTVDSMPWEVVNPSFERRLVHGERTMLAFLHLHRGCQVPRHPLRQATGIHENERGAMRFDQLREAPVDLLPDLVRHDGVER